jgi:Tfp pilus assembly protein PilV
MMSSSPAPKGATLLEVLLALTVFSSTILGSVYGLVQALKFTHQCLNQTRALTEPAINDS